MGILTTDEFLVRINRELAHGFYPDQDKLARRKLKVSRHELTRWKHRRYIESLPSRPRGRGKGRDPVLWDEIYIGTCVSIKKELQGKRNLDEAVLSAWVPGKHPVPMPTVRRLLIASAIAWWPDPSPAVSFIKDGAPDETLVDSIASQAEELADKMPLLKGIPRRHRIELISTAMKMQVGLADQEDILRALDALAVQDPGFRETINNQFLQWGGLKRDKNPFELSIVKRTIAGATNEKLLEARDAYVATSLWAAVVLLILLALLVFLYKEGSKLELPPEFKGVGALMMFWGTLIMKPVYFITATLLDLPMG